MPKRTQAQILKEVTERILGPHRTGMSQSARGMWRTRRLATRYQHRELSQHTVGDNTSTELCILPLITMSSTILIHLKKPCKVQGIRSDSIDILFHVSSRAFRTFGGNVMTPYSRMYMKSVTPSPGSLRIAKI